MECGTVDARILQNASSDGVFYVEGSYSFLRFEATVVLLSATHGFREHLIFIIIYC